MQWALAGGSPSDPGALNATRRWFEQRATPLCWVWGPPGSNLSALAREIVDEVGEAINTRVISLSAAGPDRALRSMLVGARMYVPRAAMASEVLAALSDPAIRLIVVDGVNTVQDELGPSARAEDMRVRHLLLAATEGRLGAPVLVTSPFPPPADLLLSGTTTVATGVRAGPTGRAVPMGAGAPTLLEVLASSRQASSGWFLGAVLGRRLDHRSFSTPDDVKQQLESLRSSGLVHLVANLGSGDWYQTSDDVTLEAHSPQRAEAVHRKIAECLQRVDVQQLTRLAPNDPDLASTLHERTVAHLMLIGDVEAAVECYWVELGNYSGMQTQCAYDLGARVCRTLNGGAPHAISAALQSTGRSTNVLNDWGLHALAAGDQRTAIAAATLVVDAATEAPPWGRARLHRHLEEALYDAGFLPAGMAAADRALVEARNQTRQSQGIGTQQGIDAMDDAYHAIIQILVHRADAEGVAIALTELTTIRNYARDLLVRANEHLIVPLSAPPRSVEYEDLFGGWASAWLAWLQGDAASARRLANLVLDRCTAEDSLFPDEGSMALLLVDIGVAEGDSATARHLADEYQPRLDRSGHPAALGDLKLIAQRINDDRIPDAERLPAIDEILSMAAACGLGLLWIDGLVERSRVQMSLGDVSGAQASARAALHGPSAAPTIVTRWPAAIDLIGALDPRSEYAAGARLAIEAAFAAGLHVDEHLCQQVSETSLRWQSPSLPKPRRSASDKSGPARRVELDQAARRVIEEHDTYGAPFVLYLRKYNFETLHGPFDWDARLVENALYADLPARVEMISIQSLGLIGYASGRTAFGRDAPSLLVDTENWKDVVAALIARAEMIVSEIPMLGAGTRFELETIYRLGRWDRTILILPPLRSYFNLLDSDPLIQMFPRCVWADDFHTSNFVDSLVVTDLIHRLERIATQADARRRQSLTSGTVEQETPPVALRRIVPALEARGEVMGLYLNGTLTQPDDYDEYYDFWSLFRATSIRIVELMNGDRSLENRSMLIQDYLRMAQAMLHAKHNGDTIVVTGNLVFAEQCAQSAYALIDDEDPDWLRSLRPDAEAQFNSALQLQAAIKHRPDVVIRQPRYGPFEVRESSI